MKNETLKNNSVEQEILSADEQQIRNFIGSLDKVSAPDDFDFRLKARIANADKTDFQPSIRQTLRYLFPLTATAVIAAFVLFQAGIFSPRAIQTSSISLAENTNVTQTVNPAVLPTKTEIAEFTNTNPAAKPAEQKQFDLPTSPAVSKNEIAASKSPDKKKEISPKTAKQDDPILSRDFSVKQNRKPIFPKGVDPNQIVAPVIENPYNKPIKAVEMLEILGVQTEIIAGKVAVKSVREKSLADFAKVKTGDLIEMIDDVKIDENNINITSNRFKKVTFTNDGKPTTIRLLPD